MAGGHRSSLFLLASLALMFVLDSRGASGSAGLDRGLYHSPSLLVRDYRDFLARFKVFVYPVLKNSSSVPDLRHDDGMAAGSLFMKSLLESGFVTDDPEAADLFFIPASVDALWRRRPDSKGIAHSLKAYIQQLRDLYPYWQRSLGADHFFLSCRDITSDWSRNVLELKKNAIQVACFPLARDGDQEFLAHKDITMPLPGSASIGPSIHRRNLAFYDSSRAVVDEIPASWRSSNEFVTGDEQLLATTSFCLSVGPKDRHLIIPAVRLGCIPVIFSSGKLADLPFQDILDWNSFAIILGHDQLHKARYVLESIDEGKLSRLRKNGGIAAMHMEWHSPPQREDAFYTVMYQLWRRRHVSRYVD